MATKAITTPPRHRKSIPAWASKPKWGRRRNRVGWFVRRSSKDSASVEHNSKFTTIQVLVITPKYKFTCAIFSYWLFSNDYDRLFPINRYLPTGNNLKWNFLKLFFNKLQKLPSSVKKSSEMFPFDYIQFYKFDQLIVCLQISKIYIFISFSCFQLTGYFYHNLFSCI